jgi:DNA-binding CsgD family transcriptional regulator
VQTITFLERPGVPGTGDQPEPGDSGPVFPAPRLDRLTPRQIQILTWVAQGYSNHGIATALNLSVGTVEKRLSEIVDKLALPGVSDPDRARYNVRVLAALAFLAGCARLPHGAGRPGGGHNWAGFPLPRNGSGDER